MIGSGLFAICESDLQKVCVRVKKTNQTGPNGGFWVGVQVSGSRKRAFWEIRCALAVYLTGLVLLGR